MASPAHPIGTMAGGESPRRRTGRLRVLTISLLSLLVLAPAASLAADVPGKARQGRIPAAPARQAAAPPERPAAGKEILPFDSLVDQRWVGDLAGMRQRRVIRALVAYSKTFYFLDGAQQRGLTYESLRKFEDFVNEKLRTGPLRIHVVFIPMSRDELLSGLREGRGDLAAANLTVTPERQALVDFSRPFLADVREIVVTGPRAPRLTRLDDLAGQEVHVRPSSSYHASLQALSARLVAAGRRPITIRPADEALEDEDLLEMMNTGLIAVTVVDQHKAEFWATVFDHIRLRRELAVRTGGQIAWAVRKSDRALRALIDEFAAKHGQGSATHNVLLRRYLRDNKWARDPTAQKEMQKFRAVVGLFQRYAGRYGFDHLMVAAQAYQESRLEQRLKSPAGAVGVMQVKPSTAAGPPIEIRDIDRLENNIHAGVKYLRFIVDRYFPDEGLDPVNRGLFAFAAYNAGPARIDRLRREAARMGLDPNRWFGHVERVAARRIGRETVQYVSNIYKYYIAYRMVTERESERDGARREAQPAGAGGRLAACASC